MGRKGDETDKLGFIALIPGSASAELLSSHAAKGCGVHHISDNNLGPNGSRKRKPGLSTRGVPVHRAMLFRYVREAKRKKSDTRKQRKGSAEKDSLSLPQSRDCF